MTAPDEEFVARLRRAGVVPVVTIEDAGSAVPFAKALRDGGLDVIEVTLRTAAALDAIRRIATEMPDIVVGAGTVLSKAQAEDAVAAGARFLVSPGLTPAIADAGLAAPIPLLPGVATASEAMAAAERGITFLKFFPAESSGGAAVIKSLAAPLPHLRFCPTGGIGAANAASYLSLANVVCVGGSWMAPTAAVRAGDWAGIASLSAEASQLAGRARA
jgi:2-dehydro-3-deoxyphosphogluconate aldolase/(4S)-4-hydroxy-2-oxoglutarate aldolase